MELYCWISYKQKASNTDVLLALTIFIELVLQTIFLPHNPPPAVLADGALTTVAAKVCFADDLLTEKNCLFPSKPEYFRLDRKAENIRKKPRHPKMTRLS